MFCFEDVHWSDPTSLEALSLVIAQVKDARVLVVLTYRPEFEPSWDNDGHVTTYTLNRLSRRQTVGLVEHVTGGKELPPEVLDQIVAKTDGIPLFVEELTKHVLESEWLVDVGESYQLSSASPELAIPATLEDSLMARLDRLAEVKEVVQLGATIGREFPYALLHAVSPLSETDLQDALGQLLNAGLISKRGHSLETTYSFKHALIQDAAYASMLRSTRQKVHREIAQVLATEFPETVEIEPELVAHHYTEAGQGELAVTFWQKAGERARAHAADVEAIAHFRTGLDLLTTLPVTSEQIQREIDLQILLALAYTASKGQAVPEVEEAYVKARELCERVHDDYRLFRVLIGLYRCLGVRNEYQAREEVVKALVQVAQRVQDPRFLLEAHMVQANIAMFDGAYQEARNHCERALANYDRHDHHSYVAQSTIDPGVNVLSRLSWTLWCLGYPEQALVANQEMLTLAWELGHDHTLAMFSNFAALTHQLCGENQSVDELTRYAMQLSTEHGFHQLHMSASIMQGCLLACQGGQESGLTQMKQGLTDYRQTGNALYQAWYLTLLAEGYRHHRQSSAGLEVLTEAIAIGRPFFQPEIHRIKGELLLMQSWENQAEAEACFEYALNLSRQQAAKSWELRAAVSLSRLWHQQSKSQDAYELLAPAYEWFTEGFDTADLQEAKALLSELRV